MERLDRCLRAESGLAGSDWQRWARVYLAGGSASEWAGSRPNDEAQDLDVLVGVDFAAARSHSSFRGMDDGQATAAVNAALRGCFNDPQWRPAFGGTWALTGYCNQAIGHDVTAIRPYAAYDVTAMRWAVVPPHLPQHSLADFSPAVLAQARAVLAEARAILRMDEPLRTREARALWERIHAERGAAFSPAGQGWEDPGNVAEKMTAYAPGNVLGRIRELALAGDKTASLAKMVAMSDDQVSYEHVPSASHYDPHEITARHPGSPGDSILAPGEAGRIQWRPDTGEVVNVRVHKDYQRRGIGTELWNRARAVSPGLRHSDTLSEDARKWIPSLGKSASWDNSGTEASGVYLRFGDWPADERSFSGAGGYHEEGVSAYDLDRHGNPDIDHGLDRGHQHDESCERGCDGDWLSPDNDPREEMQGRVARAERNRRHGSDKPRETGHLVRGEMSGVGYDGEPLLTGVRRVGDWIDHRHLFIPGAKPHRLARDPSDEDYEPPEEDAPGGGMTREAAHEPREAARMVPIGDLASLASEYGEDDDGAPITMGDVARKSATQLASDRYSREELEDLVERTRASGTVPGAIEVMGDAVTDGLHRYWAASKAGLTHVPVEAREEAPAQRRQASADDGPAFYHGTGKRYRDGDLIDPAQPHKKVHPQSDPGKVYFSDSAWNTQNWADVASPSGRGHVYEVEPPGEDAPGGHHVASLDDDGADGYTECDQGHEHWGTAGAAGLLIRHEGGDGQYRYLLQERSPAVQHGGTWSTPGGALRHGESPEEGAVREAREELGELPGGLRHHHTFTDDHGGWAYHTVVMDSPRRFSPGEGEPGAEWESSGHGWFTPQQVRELPLHPGFAASWDKVRKSGAARREDAAPSPGPAGTSPGPATEGAFPLEPGPRAATSVGPRRQPWMEWAGSGQPHKAVIFHAQKSLREEHPELAQRLGEPGPDGFSAGGEGLLRRVLVAGGYPPGKAERAFVIRHEHPERSSSQVAMIGTRMGIALHPGSWNAGTLAHEAGHLLHIHQAGWNPAGQVPDEVKHGPAFAACYATALEAVSPGCGQDFLRHHRDAMALVGNYRRRALGLPREFPGSGLEAEAPAPRTAASGYSGLTGRSGMIYLPVPEGRIQAVKGGVDDHHVTVAYLGKDVDDKVFARACDRAREAAAAHHPMDAVISGLGTFPPSGSSDGKTVAFVPVHAPGSGALRASLEDLSASQHKDWRPHVTLAYLEEGEPLPPPHPPVGLRFTRLHVRRGDDDVSFPLGG